MLGGRVRELIYRRGRERAERLFDEERMVDSICLLYRELLGQVSNSKEALPVTE